MLYDNIPHLEIYGPRITILLNDVKLLKNKELSYGRKILGICVTGMLLSLSFLLIISETIDIKNSHDLPSFAAHINPIAFHLVGALKWICGIMRVNVVENLIRRMKRCHELALMLNDYDKGMI